MKARSPSSSTPTRRFESTHVEKKTKRWACASVLRALRALGEKRKVEGMARLDRKSTRLNSSHGYISYAVFCLKKKNNLTTWLSKNPGVTSPSVKAIAESKL